MEKMALSSHNKVGHECHLWTYQDVKGVPDGVIVEDARQILPENDVFAYKIGEGKGSFSAFSNYFRYQLIYEYGGWWCDTDLVCLKPFDFEREYVFASERTKKGHSQIASCAFLCPPSSETMRYCLDATSRKNKDTLQWGEVGPLLLSEAVIMTDKEQYAEPSETFCPINWFDATTFVTDHIEIPDSYAVHLWNEIWRRRTVNKNAAYPKGCLYERLKNAIL